MANKKKFIRNVFIVFIIFIMFIVISAEAINASVSSLMKEAGDTALYITDDPDKLSPAFLIGNIIKAFLSLLGIIFMGLTLYGGYLWMSARGNEEQVKKAQNTIRDSVIGLVIAIAAYAITYFILATLAANYVRDSGGFTP